MIPKHILQQYPKEDWEIMQKSQKELQVFNNITGIKCSKRELKKEDPETYYSWLYRATFHMTAVRLINGREYMFKNLYNFTN